MGALKTIWVLSLLVSATISQQNTDRELNDIISQIFGNNSDVFSTPPITTIPDTTSRQVETTVPITNAPPYPTDSQSTGYPTDSTIPTTGVFQTNIGELNVCYTHTQT